MKTGKMGIDDYADSVLKHNYIDEYLVEEPRDADTVTDMIINNYPLPAGLTRKCVKEWVEGEIADALTHEEN